MRPTDLDRPVDWHRSHQVNASSSRECSSSPTSTGWSAARSPPSSPLQLKGMPSPPGQSSTQPRIAAQPPQRSLECPPGGHASPSPSKGKGRSTPSQQSMAKEPVAERFPGNRAAQTPRASCRRAQQHTPPPRGRPLGPAPRQFRWEPLPQRSRSRPCRPLTSPVRQCGQRVRSP